MMQSLKIKKLTKADLQNTKRKVKKLEEEIERTVEKNEMEKLEKKLDN